MNPELDIDCFDFFSSMSSTTMEVIEIPDQQLISIKSTSKEVLINVCDQVVERTSKCLMQRSRINSVQIITIEELCSMANIVALLNQESLRMTSRVSNGLLLSLQVLVKRKNAFKIVLLFLRILT